MFNLTKKSLFSSLALLFILAGCGGESGTSEKSIASLTDAPTVNLSSSSYTVNNDDSIILSWSSTDTNSCIASGAWTGVKALEGSETIGPITVDGTYTLNCGGDSSTVSDSVNIVVSENLPPFPTISLQASPALVSFNGSTELSWSSTDATSCSASGAWSGTKNTAGSQTISSLTANSTFVLSCTGERGTANYSIDVTVAAPSIPVISLSASPSLVESNGSTTLSWTSSSANSCIASGSWSGSKAVSGSEVISSIIADSTFNLNCTGSGGTANYSVNVSVIDPVLPTVLLSASPLTVTSNGSTTLSWSSANATSCMASGGWSGNKGTSGSQVIDSLQANTTFNISCTGTGGTDTDSVSISVVDPVLPTLSMSASPSTVTNNGSTTLSWLSTDATTCLATGDWSGSKSVSGSQTISSLVADSTFNLSCTGSGGTANYSVNVSVLDPEPTVTISASPSTVSSNGSTTLSWTSTDATSCNATGDWSGSKSVSGSQTISSLVADSTFNLSCTGSGGTANYSVNVSVLDPEPTVTISASPSTVSSNGSTTLSWTSTDATSCNATGDWSGSKSVSGSQTINSIIADSSFTLSCTGEGGTVNRSVDVSVVVNNTGTALLSWVPSTENTDESVLTDLAGYKIYYGTSPGNYSETITLDNPGLSSYLVESLPSATWYFVMSSYNASNIESSYSGEVSKVIN